MPSGMAFLAMISVLVVDDDELFRAELRSRLERETDITPVGEAGTAERARRG